MDAERAGLVLVALLVTYAVHSTVALTLGWLVTRRLGARDLARRERVWKLAVLAGIATACLQVGLGIESPLGRLALGNEARLPIPAAEEASAALPPRPVDRAGAVRGSRPASTAPRPSAPRSSASPRGPLEPPLVDVVPAPTAPAAAALPAVVRFALAPTRSLAAAVAIEARLERPPPARASLRPSASLPPVWTRAALAAWSLSGLVGALLLSLGLRRLGRELRGRVRLRAGPLVERLERLAARAGLAGRVRLFVAPRLGAPLSMGWLRPAVCLPPRALLELDDEEQTAMLAHEVAHLARRDPPWLFALWLIQTVFFFQPLNRLARRELAETFELAADAWAVRATGERLALASCLARIAGWLVGARPPRADRAWSAAMADALDAGKPRSRLGARITCLLEDEVERAPARRRRLETLCSAATLALLVVVVPGASATSAGAGPVAPVEAPSPRAPAAAAPRRGPESELSRALFGPLDAELDRLEEEIGALHDDLARSGRADRFGELLQRLEGRARRMRARRDRMAELLESALAEQASRTAGLATPAGLETHPAKGSDR